MAAGFLGASIVQVVNVPLDGIKLRVMTDNNRPITPMFDHARAMFREKALFNAASTRIAKIGLSTGIMLGGISYLNRNN